MKTFPVSIDHQLSVPRGTCFPGMAPHLVCEVPVLQQQTCGVVRILRRRKPL